MGHMNKIKKYYEDNYVAGYPDYFIQGWESQNAQRLRFEQLISDINLNGKSIIDIGCGTGNLLEFINMRFSGYSYIGIDILPHMLERANNKKLPGEFICLDIFKDNPFKEGQFDALFSSGIFNLNLDNNRQFLIDALKLFKYLSHSYISFNLLWDQSPDKEDKYFYFSPEEVKVILKDNCGPDWEYELLMGYLKNDFTVHLKRRLS